jgi:hypothetical protein
VTLLIGLDHTDPLEFLENRKDPLRKNAPQGVRTHFGWTVMGDVRSALQEKSDPYCNLVSLNFQSSEERLASTLDKFILMDDFGARADADPPVGKEMKRCRRILEETTKFIPEEGAYEAGILFKSDAPNLPSKGALDRFKKM